MRLAKQTKLLGLGAIAISAMALGGCASQNLGNVEHGYMTNVTGSTFEKTHPKDVKLVFKNQPNQKLPCAKYKTIGEVTVDTYEPYLGLDRSQASISEKLQAGGASMGADAVINIATADQKDIGYAIKCEK